MTPAKQNRRWVITTTLNDNLLRAKIPPLLEALPDLRLTIVTDRIGPAIDRVTYSVPKESSVRRFGRLLPRWFLLWREIARPGVERVMVYNAVPHLLLVFLPAKLLGKKLDLHMIAGQVDLDFVSTARWSDNRVISAMRSEFRLKRLERLTQWIARRCCNRLFVPGGNTRQWLLDQGFPAERIVMIHSAIDTEVFSSGGAPRDIDILIVANFKAVKQPQLTIRILEDVLKQRSDSKFVWIGDGPLREEVFTRLTESPVRDACEMIGHTEDVVSFARRAKLFLINSVTEGLSCATMEAMACGVVPVSSDVGDMGEVVRNGETGVLISENGAPKDYARAIIELLDNEPELDKRSLASRDLIVREHSYSAIIRAWQELDKL